MKLNAQREALIPWLKLDVPMSFKGTKVTTALIGTFPLGIDAEDIQAQLAQVAPEVGPVYLEMISRSLEQTCVFALCFKQDELDIENALRVIGFARPVTQTLIAPALFENEIEKSIRDTNQAIADAIAEIISYGRERTRLWFMVDYYHIRAQKYEVIGKLVHSHRTFILTGFIPAKKAPALERELRNSLICPSNGKYP